jgi:hypothetical protein
MKKPEPITSTSATVRLEPMTADHVAGLEARRKDGELWNLRVTSVPAPGETRAMSPPRSRDRPTATCFPSSWWTRSGRVIGSTRYHDIVPRWNGWRSATPGTARAGSARTSNTRCKLLLMTHAFETLGAQLWAGAPTTTTSPRSARSSGWARARTACCATTRCGRDGTVRDTVMYSLAAGEWPEVKAHLQHQLARPRD